MGIDRKEEFAKRLLQAFENKGFATKYGFYTLLAEKYGVSKQTPADWFDPAKGYPRLEMLIQLSEDVDVSIDYLLQTDKSRTGMLPLLTYAEAVAQSEEGESGIYLPAVFPVGKGFVVVVEDDSMVSSDKISYPKGSYAVFDKKKSPVGGDLVFADVGGSGVFAQFIDQAGRMYLSPLNPRYQRITDDFTALGVLAYVVQPA